MMSSSNKEEAVQPSPPLIAALQRRLRDPSIVPQFESRFQSDATARLICHHWVLSRSNEDEVDRNAVDASKTNDGGVEQSRSGTESSIATGTNFIPSRNYIGLRVQQNRLFANERYNQYKKLFTDWKSDTNGCTARDRNKQWETMKSCIKEGLAAYPEHEGLLNAQQTMNNISSENSGMDVEPPVGGSHLDVQQRSSKLTNNSASISGTTHNESIELKVNTRKGVEGRANAAIRDALLERNFLTDGATTAVGGYTLLPEEDEHLPNPDEQIDDESSNSSDSRRRHRKEKKHKKEKYKKKRKYKHEKKKHKHRRKKRSRSSSASRSPS